MTKKNISHQKENEDLKKRYLENHTIENDGKFMTTNQGLRINDD